MTLTPAALLAYLRNKSLPPTQRELAEHFGVGTTSIATVLRGLAAAELIELHPAVARGILLTPRGRRIPLEDVALAVDLARVEAKHRRNA